MKGRPSWAVKPDYPDNLFCGAAGNYAAYRVPYPRSLLEDLLQRSRARGDGLLVDLACGTGQIAIPLAPHFRCVLAVDRETEMLAVGRRKAALAGIGNIDWQAGLAEDAAIEDQSCELVAIGNAFHRLDRFLVAETCRRWLCPGGCFAILGSSSLYSGTEPWQLAAVEVVRKWIDGDNRRKVPSLATGTAADSQPHLTHQAVLERLNFTGVAEYSFPVRHRWSLPELIGYVGSLSGASPLLLGDRFELLKRELESRLAPHATDEGFEETIEFYYILWRKT